MDKQEMKTEMERNAADRSRKTEIRVNPSEGVGGGGEVERG